MSSKQTKSSRNRIENRNKIKRMLRNTREQKMKTMATNVAMKGNKQGVGATPTVMQRLRNVFRRKQATV